MSTEEASTPDEQSAEERIAELEALVARRDEQIEEVMAIARDAIGFRQQHPQPAPQPEPQTQPEPETERPVSEDERVMHELFGNIQATNADDDNALIAAVTPGWSPAERNEAITSAPCLQDGRRYGQYDSLASSLNVSMDRCAWSSGSGDAVSPKS